MLKKIISVILSISLLNIGSISPFVHNVSAEEKSITDYSYTITPIMEPFNNYFFVKTDNPDPTSFRFVDKSSKYSEESIIALDWDDWNEEVIIYEDIKYENKETGRVDGGYIFESSYTDGGEIVLQSKNDAHYSWDVTWSDTEVKLNLPDLKDEVDYLIDTYANKTGFFDNMDNVETGLNSICLYSGSYIRGELYKSGSFWGLSNSPHIDQFFYIQSPYSRKDNKNLFASAVYPFRYDSLGFPSMMARVSERLDSSSSYEWDEYSHYIINVTYGGETRRYGGAGEGKGQGISEDKIKQYFTFGANGTDITLEGTRRLLDEYSLINMADDVPRSDALTWEKIYDRVGDGSWVRIIGIASIFGGTYTTYAYLYQNGDGTSFWKDEAGNDGSEIYWGGDLDFCCDTWVDGRYISPWEDYVPGEKFEDHPTSSIFLKNVSIPQITYNYQYVYNSESDEYEEEYSIISINEKETNALFRYNDGKWMVSWECFDDGCADSYDIKTFVEKGLIDSRYLDMVTLTPEEVETLDVDKNTDIIPSKGLVYDGSVKPGTPYDLDNAGWKKDSNGWWYDNGDSTYPKNTWETIDGKEYYFNASGYMATGWLYYGENWYYLGSNGAMVTGWLKDGNNWYYLESNGKMATGWKQGSGKWYYLESNGKMAVNKWVDSVYYVKSDGAMAVSEWVDGGRYYVDSTGKWFPNKTRGSWKKDTKGWWFDNENGTYPKNTWKYIDGNWYYFNNSGYMVTGWLNEGGNWYYLESNGKMAANKWVEGKYYMKSNGVMATDEWIDGTYYVKSNGVMATNELIDGMFYVGADGKIEFIILF